MNLNNCDNCVIARKHFGIFHVNSLLIAVLLSTIIFLSASCTLIPNRQQTAPTSDIGLTTPDMSRVNEAPLVLSQTQPIDDREAAKFCIKLDTPLEVYDALRPGGSVDLDTLEHVEIERVIDGDTLAVSRNGQSVRLRLIGVDAPESYSHHDESARTHVGESVSRIVKQWLDGRAIYLQFDTTETDKYDRLLAYAWLDAHTMINEVLVREGLAEERRYEPTTRYNDYFKMLEEKARQEGRGVWSQSSER